ncbi:MAG: phospho-N-acetylmuramoyl-pentapeptide-transferase [Pseudomonadota bacterium]
MLYNLLAPFADNFIGFNLFRYITFRTGGALITAFILSLMMGPHLIAWLKSKQGAGQPIRNDGPESHFKKTGTPTMGGLMILVAVTAATLLWADIANVYIWFSLIVMGGYGAIGFVDDYLKLTKRDTKGLTSRQKLFVQIAIGALVAGGIMAVAPLDIRTAVAIPYLKDTYVQIGVFFIPWVIFVIVGSSNAVNLTDGLDGLAIVPVAIAAASFGLIAYLVGHIEFAKYLHIPHVPGTGELAVLCGALIGAGLGFLWFNAAPAQVFMGDTGSLALGGVLGCIGLITKHELLLAVIGGIFVMETLSVIIQVVSFKTRGKRVFRMAPIHHHFEKCGWPETTVVIRFWIMAVIFALIGLASLKLR